MSLVFMQDFAPPHVMRAGLDTVSWLCVYARNKSLNDQADIRELNDLMEAVHEVPRMLMRWSPDQLKRLRIHLGCFHSDRYPGAPDFVAYFDRRLEEYQTAEQSTGGRTP